tara:strand:+ start:2008 stop:2232 length:225 start_codon:yes stop_codon:yes gene_type:complete
MDKIDELIDKFNVKYDTHPELVNLWTIFLSIKKIRISQIIQQSETALELMETNDDIPLETIILLFSLNRTNNNV